MGVKICLMSSLTEVESRNVADELWSGKYSLLRRLPFTFALTEVASLFEYNNCLIAIHFVKAIMQTNECLNSN